MRYVYLEIKTCFLGNRAKESASNSAGRIKKGGNHSIIKKTSICLLTKWFIGAVKCAWYYVKWKKASKLLPAGQSHEEAIALTCIPTLGIWALKAQTIHYRR